MSSKQTLKARLIQALVEPDVKAWIQKAAKEEGCSDSDIVRRAVYALYQTNKRAEGRRRRTAA